MTRADPNEALLRSIARDLQRLAELEELLLRGHAERLGIHVTDVRCLVALADESPSTAGKLAERLELSTGAVTAMLDRLEKLGLVRREKSPEDRRQVLVTLGDAGAHTKDASELWLRTAHRALGDVEPAEAKRLRSVLDKLIFGLSEEVERVRGIGTRHEAREALLRITRSGQKVVIAAGESDGELVMIGEGTRAPMRKATSDPDISMKADVVTVGGGSLLLPKKNRVLRLSLSKALPWRLEVHGNGSLLDCRVEDLDVRSVDIVGGANQMSLHLGPAMATSVPIRLKGGASHLMITRPRAVGVRVVVHDSLSAALLDGKPVVALGNATAVESDGFSAREPHYEVELKGGASHVSVAVAKD